MANNFLNDYDKAEHLAGWGFTGTFCNHCGKKNSEISGLLMQCGKCKQAYYCSSKCFNDALPIHSQYCNTDAWKRDPKGSVMAQMAGSATNVDRSSKDYVEPNKGKSDKIKGGDDKKKGKKGDFSLPDSKYEAKPRIPPASMSPKKSSKKDKAQAEDVETEKNTHVQHRSVTKSSETGKGAKKKSLALYDDDDDSEESATVATERVDDVGDEITEAVMKARQDKPYVSEEFDSDDEGEQNYEVDYDSDFDNGNRKNKAKMSGIDSDSSDDDDESDKRPSKVKSKKRITFNFGEVSSDEESEEEIELIKTVSVTTKQYVKSQLNNPKLKADRTRLDGVPEEDGNDASKSKASGAEGPTKTKTRLEKKAERDGNSPRWPSGSGTLPEKSIADPEEVNLRHITQLEKKDHGWQKPDWANPSLRRVSAVNNDGNDSFTADDILAMASDQEEASKGTIHNSLSLNDVNNSSRNNQLDNESDASIEIGSNDKTSPDFHKSIGTIRPSRRSHAEREARRSGRGRLSFHRSFIDDDEYFEIVSRKWRENRGEADSEISKEEALKLRHIEMGKRKEPEWEKPSWTKTRERRLSRSRSDESPLFHCSANFEREDGDLESSIANLRQIGEQERKEYSWHKPDWVKSKPIGRRRGMADSASVLNYIERDKNNNEEEKDLYKSFSGFNYTPSTPEVILATKDELRKAETIRNKQYEWKKPEWMNKSPLKKSAKLSPTVTNSFDRPKVEPIASTTGSKVDWKKTPERSNNKNNDTKGKSALHEKQNVYVAKQSPMTTSAAKPRSTLSNFKKTYHYEEDTLYGNAKMSVTKENESTTQQSKKKYHYQEDLIYIQ